jgi:hypothetical protein
MVQLRSLALRGLGLDAVAATAIVSNLKDLTSLDLWNNEVRADGAIAIASNLKRLAYLNLSYNRVGADGAKAIARSLRQLTSLDLSYNRVGADGAKAIARSLRQLTFLDLSRNQVGDDGAKAIASDLKQLTSLNLVYNEVGADGARAIASNLERLTSFDLGYNHVGDEGAKAIASNLRRLTSLYLWNNHVGDDGAKAIASNLKRLTSLNLSSNQVGDDGAKAIASNLGQLSSLYLIYDKHLERDRDKALLLSRYLHDIGVFLHFQDDLRLRKTVIVQNHWATEAVFRVLDDERVKARVGYFDRTDCARLWAGSEYADMHMELLALMERFELCYQLPGNERWLAPQLLSPSTPEYVKDWAKPSDLVLTYRYAFLPRGLVSRLMVRTHRFVAHPEKSWSSGAFFEQEGTELLALTESTGDAITLRARGPEKKALLSVIASALDELNASFQGLADKIHKKVPCICDKFRQKTMPEQFDEKRLLQRRRDGKPTIECPSSYADVSVLELLDGVKLDQLPKWANTERTIRIFLASPEELRADRDAFDLYFQRQNHQLQRRGLKLEVVRWEDFLDAMSETRLQDEYNRKIRACDIFVALFMTKTGKFTDEEFDVAHAQFQKTGKPIIYTFFRKATVPTTQEGHANLATLLKFQEKLKRLGHFWTQYESADDLKLQFKDQLEKLEETNFEGHHPPAAR